MVECGKCSIMLDTLWKGQFKGKTTGLVCTVTISERCDFQAASCSAEVLHRVKSGTIESEGTVIV